MMTVRGKEKRIGRRIVEGSSWKKAVVTLKREIRFRYLREYNNGTN